MTVRFTNITTDTGVKLSLNLFEHSKRLPLTDAYRTFYANADGFILFLDDEDYVTFINVLQFIRSLGIQNSNIIVVRHKMMGGQTVLQHQDFMVEGLPGFDINNEHGFHVLHPILLLARNYLRDQRIKSLTLTTYPTLKHVPKPESAPPASFSIQSKLQQIVANQFNTYIYTKEFRDLIRQELESIRKERLEIEEKLSSVNLSEKKVKSEEREEIKEDLSRAIVPSLVVKQDGHDFQLMDGNK